MESIELIEVARVLRSEGAGLTDLAVTGVSTDSRTVAPGELFFAIEGERLDGHNFVAAAFERGGVAAVVSDATRVGDARGPLLSVADTTHALQELAAWYRRLFDIPVVGVTGTNGKTTTKDMAEAAISTSLRTMKTLGNYNNHIGVPLTLFQLGRRHEAAVVEMGMNHAGEIARLSQMAKPTVGVITNVAEAHLASMSNVDAIAAAKGELLDALPPDGAAVLNADDPRVMSQAGRTRARVVTFGLSSDADFRAGGPVEIDGSVSFELVGTGAVELPVPGRHNVLNALAAIASASVLGVNVATAARGLSCFKPSDMRMRQSALGDWTVLNDAYNCNPGSLRAALETLVSVGGDVVKAAVLGDMLELGKRSESAHREAGLKAASLGIDFLFLFGKEVSALRDGAIEGGMSPSRVSVFESKAALVRAVRSELAGPAVLLVKGSRGMRMEEAVELLTQGAPAS